MALVGQPQLRRRPRRCRRPRREEDRRCAGRFIVEISRF